MSSEPMTHLDTHIEVVRRATGPSESDRTALARIYPEVVAKATAATPRQTWWGLVPMAATALLLVGLATVLTWHFGREAPLTIRAAQGSIQRVSARVSGPVAVGKVADVTSVFQVAGQSTLVLERRGVATLTVSRAQGLSWSKPAQVTLVSGEMRCEVTPRGQQPPFVVRVGAGEVRVVGTLFSMAADEQGLARVQVENGTVEVRPEPTGQTILLHAGDVWQRPVLSERREAPAFEESAPTDRPTRTRRHAAKDMTRPDPLAELLARGACAQAEPGVWHLFGKAAALEHAGARALELSECYLQKRQRPKALSVLTRLLATAPHSEAASSALFELARLESDQGDKASALAHLRQYLAEFPQGEFVATAEVRRCELLTALKNWSDATACVAELRKTAHNRAAVAHAAWLLGAAFETAGRWADAFSHYQWALELSSDPARQERALAAMIRCAVRVGRADKDALVADYLKMFPQGAGRAEVEALSGSTSHPSRK